MIAKEVEAGNNCYPLCPYCDKEVDDVDTYSFEFIDEYVFLYRHATCPKCGCNLKWNERYTWNGKFYDVEEEE